MNKQDEATIKLVREKIVRAYSTRDDYPPFARNVFEDRSIYQAFILRVIDDLLK